MSIHAVTKDTFDEVLRAHSFVLVDFWAQWCGPCKGFSEVLEHVAPEYPECFFASVDVEVEKALAAEFSVRSVPFVMIIRDRVVVYAESGALSADSLRELLKQAKALDSAQLQSMRSNDE